MRAYQFLAEAGFNPNGLARQYGQHLIQAFQKDRNPGGFGGQPDMQFWHKLLANPQAYQLDQDPITHQKFPEPKSGTEYLAEHQAELIKKLIDLIAGRDPTPRKEYANWLVKQYAQGQVASEDINRWDIISSHYQGKQRRMLQPEHTDINRFRTYRDFEQAMTTKYSLDQLLGKQEKKLERGDATELYKDDSVRIIVPNDEAAACYYGQGTIWCTAATKGDNRYEDYAGKGDLYILLPKKPLYHGEKYQVQFESQSFMNEEDEPVDQEWLLTERFDLSKVPKFKEYLEDALILNPIAVDDLLTEIKTIIERTTKEEIKELERRGLRTADSDNWYSEITGYMKLVTHVAVIRQAEQDDDHSGDMITLDKVPDYIKDYLENNFAGTFEDPDMILGDFIDRHISVFKQGNHWQAKNTIRAGIGLRIRDYRQLLGPQFFDDNREQQ